MGGVGGRSASEKASCDGKRKPPPPSPPRKKETSHTLKSKTRDPFLVGP